MKNLSGKTLIAGLISTAAILTIVSLSACGPQLIDSKKTSLGSSQNPSTIDPNQCVGTAGTWIKMGFLSGKVCLVNPSTGLGELESIVICGSQFLKQTYVYSKTDCSTSGALTQTSGVVQIQDGSHFTLIEKPGQTLQGIIVQGTTDFANSPQSTFRFSTSPQDIVYQRK